MIEEPVDVLGQLRTMRDRITAAITALEGDTAPTPTFVRTLGRPKGSVNRTYRGVPVQHRGPGRPPGRPPLSGRRTMSAAARKRISLAMKARWSEVKARSRRTL